MIECLRERGYRFRAGWRGRDRMSRLSGPPRWTDSGGLKPAMLYSPTDPASIHIGGVPVARDTPEFAGKTFVCAFMGKRVGRKICHWLPGLMVAINRCNDEMGRITPDAISVN